MLRRTIASSFLLLVLAACSSAASTGAPASGAPPASASADPSPAGPVDPPVTPTPPDACGIVPKSQCKTPNEGSIVRGIVKFDPAHFAGKNKPVLRLFLHHQIVLAASESKQGGHPHVWVSVTDVDVARGEVPFALDQCEFGTAMYSEENCGFNLVAILDESGAHDPDVYGVNAFVPRTGELAKLTPLDISCHAGSACLSITADCVDGEACSTFQPLTSCKCAASACPSDSTACSLSGR